MPCAHNVSLRAAHKLCCNFPLSLPPSLSFSPPLSFSLSLPQENVEGENCDRCKLGFYDLQGDNRRGCEKCSCMGVSSQCSASTWTYENVGNATQTYTDFHPKPYSTTLLQISTRTLNVLPPWEHLVWKRSAFIPENVTNRWENAKKVLTHTLFGKLRRLRDSFPDE